MQYLISVHAGFMVFRQAQGYMVMARQEVLYVWIEFSELGPSRLSGLINWLWGLQRAAAARSCAESMWSIIYPVDMMMDTMSVYSALCPREECLSRMCLCDWICVCPCVSVRLPGNLRVPRPAQMHPSSTGNHVSCSKGNSETMACSYSSLLISFEHITSCTSA